MSGLSQKESSDRTGVRNRVGNFTRPIPDNTTRLELEGLAARLHACGRRAIYELLADLIRGRDVVETLSDFSRLDPAIYAALVALMADGVAHGH
jgi:hypothetical protein